ncbi:MAG TPA: ThuA domain-containing protein [Gemmatales bacterium]|nr:ThuA domain-containing protein [Gemmatales bacterium]
MRYSFLFLLLAAFPWSLRAEERWLSIPAGEGPGQGKHVVLISGDEEYRSEEALPQLAKILARHHGFRCTVLFAIDPKDGTINPYVRNNIPGTELLASADLMIIATRFRELPDEQMKPIDDYVKSGKPVIGLRTATHAFQFSGKQPSSYQQYSFNSKEWPGGFGKQVLGETWVAHHGRHGVQGTRGILAPGAEQHPILRGIASGDIFGPTDVYTVKLPLVEDATPLVLGEVTETLKPDSPGVKGKLNDPMLPVAWVRKLECGPNKYARVFTTTLGASEDLLSEGTRRLLVNASYWAVGLEESIPPRSKVDLVGKYQPSPFKFEGHVRGKKPVDYAD